MWLFLLVSSFSEIVLFPSFVLAVLDLSCEHFSSHLRRLFFSNLLVVLSNLIHRLLVDT